MRLMLPVCVATVMLCACNGGVTPGPQDHASVSTLAITGIGAAQAQSLTVNGPGGSFTEHDTCSPAAGTIATVALASSNSSSSTYTVTGVAAGTCVATFATTFGVSTNVTIVVTTTNIGVQ